jgi:hypothetical protein
MFSLHHLGVHVAVLLYSQNFKTKDRLQDEPQLELQGRDKRSIE